jgi:hypothetical protein
MGRDRKRWLKDAEQVWSDSPWLDATPQRVDLPNLPRARALSAVTSPTSEALTWNDPTLTTSADTYSALFHLGGVLHNHLLVPVHIQKLVASLWDDARRPLDADTHWADLALDASAPLRISFGFPGPVAATTGGISLSVHYDFSFDMVLAIGECAPIFCPDGQIHRSRWPIKLQSLLSSPGEPKFDLELHAFTGYRYEPAVEALIQLRERPASRDQVRELALILRDEHEQIVARESCAVTLYGEQDAHLKLHIGLTPPQIERIQRLSVHIQGVCSRHEVLGSFALDP